MRRLLDTAEREAERLGHSYVGTEHVLLALLSDMGGLAAAALRSIAPPDTIRQRLHELMFPEPYPEFPSHPRPWSSAVVYDSEGSPVSDAYGTIKQYFVDHQGRPVRDSDGYLVHVETDDSRRPVLDEEGHIRLRRVQVDSEEFDEQGNPLRRERP